MPIKKGYKQLLAEANAEIETLAVETAIGLLGKPDVVFVDLRDPREMQRDGKMPGAFACTRGHAGILDRPGKPLRQAGVRRTKALHLLLCRRLALGTGSQDRTRHGS
jgi:hypothetical protein